MNLKSIRRFLVCDFVLPVTKDIRPSGTGESPLANLTDWLEVTREDGHSFADLECRRNRRADYGFLPDYLGKRTLQSLGQRFQNHHRQPDDCHSCRRRHRHVARHADETRLYRTYPMDTGRLGLLNRADGLDAGAN